MAEGMDGSMGRLDKRINGCMTGTEGGRCVWTCEWMNGSMDGELDRWVGEWMCEYRGG